MNEVYNAISRCIDYLEDQQRTGYYEATHQLQFPNIHSRYNDYNFHEGVIFQRAIICDALLDAQDTDFKINSKGLVQDIQLLINSKCTDVAGGWRYFPTLQYLPPDADDLGQIVQVLVRTQVDNISELVDEAIELIFTQGKYSNGSFETWIIDLNDQSDVNRLILKAIENMWGKGPDVEVMANLLYALNIYNHKKYHSEIKEGCEFIISSQVSPGYWNSTWYIDKFYATFVCSRLISIIFPSSSILSNAYAFIAGSQKQDGAWGDKEGDPLQTSFALLSLMAIMLSGRTVNRAVIDKGIEYIVSSQTEQGSWRGTPFIQMNTNRVDTQRGKGYPKTITYKSDTITSAFCLKALSQFHLNTIKL